LNENGKEDLEKGSLGYRGGNEKTKKHHECESGNKNGNCVGEINNMRKGNKMKGHSTSISGKGKTV